MIFLRVPHFIDLYLYEGKHSKYSQTDLFGGYGFETTQIEINQIRTLVNIRISENRK